MKVIRVNNPKSGAVWLLGGILLLALALRIYALGDGFEFVEETIMNDAAWPLSQIASEIPPDQAPMKYYFLHEALYFGRSEFLIRLPSLFFDLMSILLIFHLGSLLFDKKAALLACFFMAVSMWNIHHATLARNYVKSARKRHPIPIEPDTPFRFKATGHSDRKRHLF